MQWSTLEIIFFLCCRWSISWNWRLIIVAIRMCSRRCEVLQFIVAHFNSSFSGTSSCEWDRRHKAVQSAELPQTGWWDLQGSVWKPKVPPKLRNPSRTRPAKSAEGNKWRLLSGWCTIVMSLAKNRATNCGSLTVLVVWVHTSTTAAKEEEPKKFGERWFGDNM